MSYFSRSNGSYNTSPKKDVKNGFDVMELSPTCGEPFGCAQDKRSRTIPGQISSDFIAAKLVYKIIGYLVTVGKRSL